VGEARYSLVLAATARGSGPEQKKDRLRALRKRTRAAMIGAPLIALAGSTFLLALAGRRKRA